MRFFTMLTLLYTVVWAGEAESNEARGKDLYSTAGGYGCAVCHGPVGDGAGQAGGYIRGATLEQLQQSLENNAPMKPLASLFSEGDLKALSSYLGGLAETPLVNLIYSDDGWSGNFEPWQPGQVIDMVVYNATFESVVIDLNNLEIGSIELAPLQRLAVRGKVSSLERDTAHLSISWE
jgi:cytochrome c553